MEWQAVRPARYCLWQLQHVLAAVVGCVTPAILVANAANNAGGNVDMGLLIQVSSGIRRHYPHLLQLYGQTNYNWEAGFR